MLLMIDNYDSFTFNLVHYFQELGADIQVCTQFLEIVHQVEGEAVVIVDHQEHFGPPSPN